MVTMKQIFETLEGEEIWSSNFGDRFGERVCIGVGEPFLFANGEKFKPTKREMETLLVDNTIQEYGSLEAWKKNLEDEFGGN